VRDYNVLKAAGRPFEVVWLSCERDPEAFASTFAQFPFLAVPFDNDEREPVWKPNLQPDFNVSVFECFDTSSSAGLREFDESDRSVQKSAESTSI